MGSDLGRPRDLVALRFYSHGLLFIFWGKICAPAPLPIVVETGMLPLHFLGTTVVTELWSGQGHANLWRFL